MARSLIRKPPAAPAPPPPAVDPAVPPTPLELAAVEALRRRDGITRASALQQVRGKPPAELEALVNAAAEAPADPRPPVAEAVTDVAPPLADSPEPTADSFP